MGVTVPGTFTSGQFALPADMGQSVLDTLVAQLDAHASWDVFDNMSSTRKILRCRGDLTTGGGNGDAYAITELYRDLSTRVILQGHSDWSTTSHTGAGSTVQLNLTSFGTVTTAVNWWCVVNEREFAFILNYNTSTWRAYYGGCAYRDHISKAWRGFAYTTSAITAGTNVVIPIDRNLTGSVPANDPLTIGQPIWLRNVTPSGVALRSSSFETAAIISAVGASSITVSTLANSYSEGAIVGLDPTPMYVGQDLTTVQMATSSAGAYASTALTKTGPQNAATETDIDPTFAAFGGVCLGWRLEFRHSSVTSFPRGSCSIMSSWSNNAGAVDALNAAPNDAFVDPGFPGVRHLMFTGLSDVGVTGFKPALMVSSEAAGVTGFFFEKPEFFPAGALLPEIDSITALSSTSVRVTFAVALVNNIALTNPQHYIITPPVGAPAVSVLGVTPSGSPASYVTLSTTEMKQGASYGLEIKHLEVA